MGSAPCSLPQTARQAHLGGLVAGKGTLVLALNMTLSEIRLSLSLECLSLFAAAGLLPTTSNKLLPLPTSVQCFLSVSGN